MDIEYLLNCVPNSIFEEYFNGKRFQNSDGIYLPATPYHEDLWFLHSKSKEYALAEENSFLLKSSIIDEDLPIVEPLIYNSSERVNFGGRMANAIMLGIIKYVPALPELNEVVFHDFDEGMKCKALDAIRKIGTKI